jgi:hypothetical protein
VIMGDGSSGRADTAAGRSGAPSVQRWRCWMVIDKRCGGQICSSKESRFIMPLAHMNLVAVIDLSLNIDHFPLCQNTGIRSCC